MRKFLRVVHYVCLTLLCLLLIYATLLSLFRAERHSFAVFFSFWRTAAVVPLIILAASSIAEAVIVKRKYKAYLSSSSDLIRLQRDYTAYIRSLSKALSLDQSRNRIDTFYIKKLCRQSELLEDNLKTLEASVKKSAY